MAVNMIVTPGQVLGNCFPNEQSRFNAYAQALQVTFPLTASAFNYGTSTPTIDQQALPWYRLNPDGTPDKWYVYLNGYWIAPNPVPVSSPIREFYDGSLSSLATYDGGEGTFITNTDGTITPSIAVTSTTGPMWQPVVNLQGRFPLGVSNTASTTPSDTFTLGQSGGEIQHTLTSSEQGTLSLSVGTNQPVTPGGSTGIFSLNINGTTVSAGSPGGTAAINAAANPTSLMNPYYVGYWITRTARGFYRI